MDGPGTGSAETNGRSGVPHGKGKEMNCTTHPDIPASAYCRACGKALCESCQRMAQGVIYCQDHVPVAAGAPAAAAGSPYASPYTAPAPAPPPLAAADTSASPGLAFLLGLIPGVGAIY